MVASDALRMSIPSNDSTRALISPGFWISRFEVTNAEFRQFVEAGGYDDPELWPDSVELEGQTLDRESLLALFVDQTGMPGPATWSLGTFPEGEDQHPVEGVSWFEASAYARWAGKLLPTVFHWLAQLRTAPLTAGGSLSRPSPPGQ